MLGKSSIFVASVGRGQRIYLAAANCFEVASARRRENGSRVRGHEFAISCPRCWPDRPGAANSAAVNRNRFELASG